MKGLGTPKPNIMWEKKNPIESGEANSDGAC